MLKPKCNLNNAINFLPINELLHKQIAVLILDVDGTLISGRDISLPTNIKEWVFNAKEHFYIYLLSNNPSKKRIKQIADQLDLDYSYAASKPRKKTLENVLKGIQHKPNKIAIIGDRVFTDILVGNRLGLYTILVDSVDSNGKKNENNIFQVIERKIATIIMGEEI